MNQKFWAKQAKLITDTSAILDTSGVLGGEDLNNSDPCDELKGKQIELFKCSESLKNRLCEALIQYPYLLAIVRYINSGKKTYFVSDNPNVTKNWGASNVLGKLIPYGERSNGSKLMGRIAIGSIDSAIFVEEFFHAAQDVYYGPPLEDGRNYAIPSGLRRVIDWEVEANFAKHLFTYKHNKIPREIHLLDEASVRETALPLDDDATIKQRAELFSEEVMPLFGDNLSRVAEQYHLYYLRVLSEQGVGEGLKPIQYLEEYYYKLYLNHVKNMASGGAYSFGKVQFLLPELFNYIINF